MIGLEIAVGSGSLLIASAIAYAGRQAHGAWESMADAVEQNERRSKKNERHIEGTENYPGLLDRLDEGDRDA